MYVWIDNPYESVSLSGVILEEMKNCWVYKEKARCTKK